MARKKSKNQKEENNLDDINEISNLFSKLFRPLKILIKIHLKILSKELKKDLARYISGMVAFFMGLFFIVAFFILLNVLIIIGIIEFTSLSLFYSILILASFDFTIALICILSAGAKFKKPFLYETKKTLQETLKDIK